jgi:hypothetical protein
VGADPNADAGPYTCRGRLGGGGPRREAYRLRVGDKGGAIAARRLWAGELGVDGGGGAGEGDGAGDGDVSWIRSSRTGRGT